MNLFEQAIEKSELLNFALGKDEYFVVDRDYGTHSVISSWINYILPLCKTKGSDYVNIAIEEMITQLVKAIEIEEPERNENLLYQLHVYYYLDSEKRIKASPLTNLNLLLEKSLNNYVNILKSKHDSNANAFVNAINQIKSRGGLLTKII